MGQMNPGITPGENAPTEVVTHVPESMLEVATTGDEKQTAEAQAPAEANSKETAKAEPESKPEEQPVSERLSRRVESVVNERNAERDARIRAEERLRLMEEQLQRVVNVPSSKPETVESKYASFDKEAGYPTDPKEFAMWNREQAVFAATEAVKTTTRQNSEQAELAEMFRNNPELNDDHRLRGAVVAEREEAQRKGQYLSWDQAAKNVKSAFSSQQKQKAIDDAVSDAKSKNEAYVETTKGATPSRSSAPDPNKKMTLREMESYLKSIGEW